MPTLVKDAMDDVGSTLDSINKLHADFNAVMISIANGFKGDPPAVSQNDCDEVKRIARGFLAAFNLLSDLKGRVDAQLKLRKIRDDYADDVVKDKGFKGTVKDTAKKNIQNQFRDVFALTEEREDIALQIIIDAMRDCKNSLADCKALHGQIDF